MDFIPIKPDETQQLCDVLLAYLAEFSPQLGTPDIAHETATDALNDPKDQPLWIHHDGQRIGFMLLAQHGPHIWDLAEFGILPEHRKRGLGTQAVHTILRQYPGHWTLGVVKTPRASRHFWARCLADMPNLRKGPAQTQYQCHSYTFTTPGASP